MLHPKLLLAVAAGLGILVAGTVDVAQAADPCQTAIVKSLAKYKKVVLKSRSKCLDKENAGLPNTCPAFADLLIQKANEKVKAKIANVCTFPQIIALGYRSDCVYESPTQGAEAACASLPVTSTDEFAECMKCWKRVDLSEYLAIMYASRALDVCDGDLGETSTVCSDLDCTTPLPVQRLLGDTAENDCQRGIAKAGIKYLLKREKILEKCLLKGCTAAQCLGGTCTLAPTVPLQLAAAESAKETVIQNKCGGNRDPSPDEPGFCCRCGMGNSCMAAADRPTCEGMAGCSVQEGKECNLVDLKCQPGPKTITWWNNCPETANSVCPGDPVTTMDELVTCVDTAANVTSDELLCVQFPGYPCPPPETTTTTTTTTMP